MEGCFLIVIVGIVLSLMSREENIKVRGSLCELMSYCISTLCT
jgi:hypothetical protein